MGKEIFSDRRTVRRAFRIVLVLSLAAILVSALLISVVNDLYAFIKPTRPYLLQIDSPLSLSAFANRLEDEEIVANPAVFCLYVQAKGKADLFETFCGEVALNSNMSYREILRAVTQASASKIESQAE